MRRTLVLLAIAAVALPAAANAKGPAGASIDGPGTGGGIHINGDGGYYATPLGNLTNQSGFLPAAFGWQPDPMQNSRPQGDLGPKYTITWQLPGLDGVTEATILQDVYPYASPPVTYMKPGQKLFDGRSTRGGWFAAEPALKQTLVEVGLPKTAASGSSSDGGFFSVGLLGLFGAALVLATATTLVRRRRARPAPAA
jgi:hypothetical protein